MNRSHDWNFQTDDSKARHYDQHALPNKTVIQVITLYAKQLNDKQAEKLIK